MEIPLTEPSLTFRGDRGRVKHHADRFVSPAVRAFSEASNLAIASPHRIPGFADARRSITLVRAVQQSFSNKDERKMPPVLGEHVIFEFQYSGGEMIL